MKESALAAYFERIGIEPPARPDLEALRAIQLAHTRAIPFENLDILLGEPIRIDLESVHAKLVARRRGGYCFEHGTLLAAVLRALGFELATLAARVHWLSSAPTARTHMLLAVEVAGQGRFLVDAGFGGQTPTGPLALVPGSEAQLPGDRYRLLERGPEWMLQLWLPEGWADLYAFTQEPQLPVDYEVANHFTSTHPSSPFTRGPTAARATADGGRVALRGMERVRRLGGVTEREPIADPAQLLAVLERDFGLRFAPGTLFRPLQLLRTLEPGA